MATIRDSDLASDERPTHRTAVDDLYEAREDRHNALSYTRTEVEYEALELLLKEKEQECAALRMVLVKAMRMTQDATELMVTEIGKNLGVDFDKEGLPPIPQEDSND